MEKILVIEDDSILRENIAEFLREENFEVITAVNGKIGLDSALNEFPDLILCDVGMPEMDGYEVYKNILKDPSASLIPFIFLTSRVEKDDVRLGMGMGVDDYISKPFNFDELLNSIRARIDRKEKVIKANEEKFRALTESSLTGVFMMNGDTFDYTNEKFSRITGYTKQQLLIMGFKDLLLQEDSEKALHEIDSCMKSADQSSVIEFRIKSKTNKIRYVEMFCRAALLKNELFLIGNILDITERKKALDQIILAKEEAELANRAKGEFFANVSYELRTPLTSIIGMSELLLDAETNNEKRENIDFIISSANDLLMFMNDIIDISVIESGRYELHFDMFSLHHAIDNALKILDQKAKVKNLELIVNIHSECNLSLYGDEIKVRQIIYNIVGNAVKFTEHGIIHFKVEPLPSHDEKKCFIFTVKDTGIGIAPDKQEIIFNAFQQADNSTTRKYGGTGLGLTISKKLIELMGGKIWMQSTLRKGSTFYFILCFDDKIKKV